MATSRNSTRTRPTVSTTRSRRARASSSSGPNCYAGGRTWPIKSSPGVRSGPRRAIGPFTVRPHNAACQSGRAHPRDRRPGPHVRSDRLRPADWRSDRALRSPSAGHGVKPCGRPQATSRLRISKRSHLTPEWMFCGMDLLRASQRSQIGLLDKYLIGDPESRGAAICSLYVTKLSAMVQPTQNSFPSGSCMTTKYTGSPGSSCRTRCSTLAPSATSSATAASTISTRRSSASAMSRPVG